MKYFINKINFFKKQIFFFKIKNKNELVREEFNNFKVKVRFINNSFNRSFGVCIVKFRDVLGQRFKDSVKAVGGEEYGGCENKCLRDFCDDENLNEYKNFFKCE